MEKVKPIHRESMATPSLQRESAIRWCAGWQKQNEVLDNSNHNYYNYNTTKNKKEV